MCSGTSCESSCAVYSRRALGGACSIVMEVWVETLMSRTQVHLATIRGPKGVVTMHLEVPSLHHPRAISGVCSRFPSPAQAGAPPSNLRSGTCPFPRSAASYSSSDLGQAQQSCHTASDPSFPSYSFHILDWTTRPPVTLPASLGSSQRAGLDGYLRSAFPVFFPAFVHAVGL